MTGIPRTFASDNCAGIHPVVLSAIAEANVGHAPSYGADPVTAEAIELFRHHFSTLWRTHCAPHDNKRLQTSRFALQSGPRMP